MTLRPDEEPFRGFFCRAAHERLTAEADAARAAMEVPEDPEPAPSRDWLSIAGTVAIAVTLIGGCLTLAIFVAFVVSVAQGARP